MSSLAVLGIVFGLAVGAPQGISPSMPSGPVPSDHYRGTLCDKIDGCTVVEITQSSYVYRVMGSSSRIYRIDEFSTADLEQGRKEPLRTIPILRNDTDTPQHEYAIYAHDGRWDHVMEY